jgi:hypothetical protein
MMRRIMLVVTVALVMAAMMLAMMMPAFAGPPGGVTPGDCIPPGEFFSDVAKSPGSVPEFAGSPPGQLVKETCAQG